jgi:hypothetical protein
VVPWPGYRNFWTSTSVTGRHRRLRRHTQNAIKTRAAMVSTAAIAVLPPSMLSVTSIRTNVAAVHRITRSAEARSG